MVNPRIMNLSFVGLNGALHTSIFLVFWGVAGIITEILNKHRKYNIQHTVYMIMKYFPFLHISSPLCKGSGLFKL